MATREPAAAPSDTRGRILQSAFLEFYQNGFQGGSLNQIVEAAGITKGALFHHFPGGKQELGYTVADEIVQPLLFQRWLDPLQGSTDPVTDLQSAFRRFSKEDMESGSWLQGCPLNNLAQEMSPLDEGFHERIDAMYTTWRRAWAAALAAGVEDGTVRESIAAKSVAALLVASQMGIWGTGKSSRSKKLMTRATEAVCDYLESLRA